MISQHCLIHSSGSVLPHFQQGHLSTQRSSGLPKIMRQPASESPSANDRVSGPCPALLLLGHSSSHRRSCPKAGRKSLREPEEEFQASFSHPDQGSGPTFTTKRQSSDREACLFIPRALTIPKTVTGALQAHALRRHRVDCRCPRDPTPED